MSLTDWGLRPEHIQELARHADLRPARVIRQDRKQWLVVTEDGEHAARLGVAPPPAAGDFVGVRGPDETGKLVLDATLARRGAFVRHAADDAAHDQVVAANVDVALIVVALDMKVNARRIERYLALAHDGGARPVVVLAKADACDDVDAARAQAERVARGARVLVTSAARHEGIAEVRALLGRGVTAALLGPSGAGKSTLANALVGADVLDTGEVRAADRKGRHTTTSRQLVLLPDGGGVLLDTPGMRELAIGAAGEGLSATFDEVAVILARGCRFSDCAHRTEPGCAVRDALASGDLDEDRWESYQKLVREAARAASRASERGEVEDRRKARAFGKMARDMMRLKRDRMRD